MRWKGKFPVQFAIVAAVLPAVPVPPATGLFASEENIRGKAAEHAAQAGAAAAQHDFTRAEFEWQKVIELDPRSAQANNNLGMVYYLEHKYPEAESALRKALELDPSLTNGRVLLGATLVRQGKMAQATGELERALKFRLNDAAEKTARVSLHEAWFARGNYAKALEVLRPLAEKYPHDVDILYDLGQTYLQLASESFQKITETDPGSYRIHQILGDSLFKQARYREAILEYRLALEQKPGLPGVHYQIGLATLMEGHAQANEDAAQQEFDAELKINPDDAWSEYRLGKFYWRQRHADQAIAHLRRALQLDETIVPARLALARTLETEGKLDEAQKQLQAALRFDPDNAAAHYRLANVFKKFGHVEEAAAEMKKFDQIQAGQQAAQQQLQKVLRLTAQPDTESPDDQDQ